MNYLDLSIKEIHAALVERKVTPLDLAREAIRRAKDSGDNCFEIILEKQALAFASSLTEPEQDNFLWGIPYVAKDNLSTKGIPTTASSEVLSGYVPLFDATVIAKLKEKKAVLIGKTTLDELAMGGMGMSGHLGKTFNPYDPTHERIIGGSSCGSATAVASGIVPFALGSDTGDSTRKPAAYGGILGVKPTWGRISRYGLIPFAPSLDAIGYFTRYSIDAAILLDALAGKDAQDASSLDIPVGHYADSCVKPLSSPRILILDDIIEAVRDETIRQKLKEAEEALKKQGAILTHARFGEDLLAAIRPAYIILSGAEVCSLDANLDGIKFGLHGKGQTYESAMKDARTRGISSLTKRRFVLGSYSLLGEKRDALYLRALKLRRKLATRTQELLSGQDAILTPSALTIAPKFDAAHADLSEKDKAADNHLTLANFAGLPSITLPLGYSNGMPFGVDFMGHAFEEEKLFAIAHSFEKIVGICGEYAGNRKEKHGI